jgi:hypothetical protein
MTSPETPELLESYHKARKNYAFFSALLIAWGLLGDVLFKGPIPGFGIEFIDLDVIPFVLFILVLYYGSRISIEWFQSNKIRRDRIASIIDFSLAHFLGVSAIFVYLKNSINDVGMKGRLTSSFLEILFPIVLGVSLVFFIYSCKNLYDENKTNLLDADLKKDFIIPMLSICLIIILYIFLAELITPLSYFIFAIVLSFGGLAFLSL